MNLLDAVVEINAHQPAKITALLKKHHPSLNGVRVAVLGLSFRPDTNDMRESPAVPILRALAAEGASLKAYDPAAREEAREIFRGDSVQICDNLSDALSDAQAVVLVTRWEEFRGVPEMLRNRNPQPLFVDGRRMLDKKSFARYEGIGL
jgi:UDPglucose 6-dehydrogenase/GDP-mannose 6-dehydrogenase